MRQGQPQTNSRPATTPVADDDMEIVASLKPITSENFGYEQARHLLWRAGFGGTARQINTLVSWGPEKSVDFLLDGNDLTYADDTPKGFDKDIMRPPTEEERRMAAQARRGRDEDALARIQQERQRRERLDRGQIAEMQKWWLRRMIETPAPLVEKMALFWHGHFATGYRTIENSWHMYLQNQLFREKGLSSFATLLTSIIRDPAMLAYLDNNDSRKGRANENLAREIMELFALGIGNYSERDIKEGARALTGYTFNDDEFYFDQRNHDTGAKSILGRSGNIDGDGFVDAILAHRACAPYITRKIYGFFIADVPAEERGGEKLLDPEQRAVLRQLAGTLRTNKYNLRPLMRRMLLSEHFYSPRFMSDQIKSPSVLVVGAVRSLGTPVRDLSILNDAMDLMGQALFQPPSVKGWEGGRSWINTSTLFVRQNITTYLLTGKKPVGYDATADSLRFDAEALIAPLVEADPRSASNPDAVVDYMLRLTMGSTPPAARESLLSFLATANNRINRDTLTGLLLLITAMPEYQLC